MNPNYPSSQSGTLGESASTNAQLAGERLESAGSNTYSEAKSAAKRTGQSLRSELSNLKSDLDTLLGRAAGLSENELSAEYGRLMTKFSSLRTAAKGMAAEAGQQITRGVDATSNYVQTKPLQSVAVATGLGLLAGILLRRRD